jgi:hypothetical protein
VQGGEQPVRCPELESIRPKRGISAALSAVKLLGLPRKIEHFGQESAALAGIVAPLLRTIGSGRTAGNRAPIVSHFAWARDPSRVD